MKRKQLLSVMETSPLGEFIGKLGNGVLDRALTPGSSLLPVHEVLLGQLSIPVRSSFPKKMQFTDNFYRGYQEGPRQGRD